MDFCFFERKRTQKMISVAVIRNTRTPKETAAMVMPETAAMDMSATDLGLNTGC